MFTGFSDATIDFLWELRFHNERPWFLEHKQTFLDTLDRPMKALLNMDNLGRLIPRAKIRGKKRVMKEIVMRMEEHAQGGHDYSGKCYISNSACYDDARAVADEIEQKFPKLNGKVEIYSVGTTIGSHTGPGTVALFFWGDERKD